MSAFLETVTIEKISTLILCLLEAILSSADNFCKQLGPRSGPTKHPTWSASKLFTLWWVSWNIFWKKVYFEKKKISRRQKNVKLPSIQRVKISLIFEPVYLSNGHRASLRCSLTVKVHAPQIRVEIWKIFFSYFSTKTYVVGTQKNRLNETVLFSTQNNVLTDG